VGEWADLPGVEGEQDGDVLIEQWREIALLESREYSSHPLPVRTILHMVRARAATDNIQIDSVWINKRR
jgi:hypothetical protein